MGRGITADNLRGTETYVCLDHDEWMNRYNISDHFGCEVVTMREKLRKMPLDFSSVS